MSSTDDHFESETSDTAVRQQYVALVVVHFFKITFGMACMPSPMMFGMLVVMPPPCGASANMRGAFGQYQKFANTAMPSLTALISPDPTLKGCSGCLAALFGTVHSVYICRSAKWLFVVALRVFHLSLKHCFSDLPSIEPVLLGSDCLFSSSIISNFNEAISFIGVLFY